MKLPEGPVRTYVETKIRTAPPGELADELCRLCIQTIDELLLRIHQPEVTSRGQLMERAVSILLHLHEARPPGSLGPKLQMLYAYCADCIVRSGLSQDCSHLSQARAILMRLRQAFVMSLPKA
ncbi:MAG: flagellar protein FliS [Myxococcota bacterium]